MCWFSSREGGLLSGISASKNSWFKKCFKIKYSTALNVVLSFRETLEALWYVKCPLDAFSWLAWWVGEWDAHRSTSLGSIPASPCSATGFWATPILHQKSKSPPLFLVSQPLRFTLLKLWAHSLSKLVMIITLLLGAVVIITVEETCASARQTQSVTESLTAPMRLTRKTVVNNLYP